MLNDKYSGTLFYGWTQDKGKSAELTKQICRGLQKCIVLSIVKINAIDLITNLPTFCLISGKGVVSIISKS
jgi:hypothetical protein